MAKKVIYCVIYGRSRPSEPFADEIARLDSNAAWDELKAQYKIVGAFGDDEYAEPGSGWLENRWGWSAAREHATSVARKRGHCTLFILRSGRISRGDPFLPDPTTLDLGQNVDVRVAGDDLRPYATSGLKAAYRRQEQFVRTQKAMEHAKPLREIGGTISGELKFDYDPWRGLTTVAYCNPTNEILRLGWTKQSRRASADGTWSKETDFPLALSIPPHKTLHLETFVQGSNNDISHLWTFREGEGRETRKGHIIIGSDVFRSHHRRLIWRHWTPKKLCSADFKWLGTPHLDAERIVLRNWRADDVSSFVQLAQEETTFNAEQLAKNSRKAGKRGPTMLIIERKSDGAILGICGPRVPLPEQSPGGMEVDVACYIAEPFRQQGYGLEAMRECIRFLLHDLSMVANSPDIVAVIVKIAPGDNASRALVRRLGMRKRQEEGDRKIYKLCTGEFAKLRRSELALDLESEKFFKL